MSNVALQMSQDYSRIYVRSSVYLPNGEVDPATGMLRPDVRRRGRTQAMRMEMSRLDREYVKLDETLKTRQKEKGARMSLRSAVLLAAVLGFALLMALLFQRGCLTDKQKLLNRLTISISDTQKVNAQLNEQLAEASDPATICYAAARNLGMVPAESAQAIHLTAVDTRPNTVSAHIDDVSVSASAD